MDGRTWTPTLPSVHQRPTSLPAAGDLQDSQPSYAPHTFPPRRPHSKDTPDSPLVTPTMTIPANSSIIPGNTLPSAPASPLTPAPSPSLGAQAADWSTANAHEDLGDVEPLDDPETETELVRVPSRRKAKGHAGLGYRHIRTMFADMDGPERKRMLAELLNMCDPRLLGFVAGFVEPRLKRDPFDLLPNELCLRILTYVDDARTLARSSQVSRRWRELVRDDMAWKSLCKKFAYRRMSDDAAPTTQRMPFFRQSARPPPIASTPPPSVQPEAMPFRLAHAHPDWSRSRSLDRSISIPELQTRSKMHSKAMTYYSHFKERYQVETAWRTGGKVYSHQLGPDQGVVTSLHLTNKYIVVALDNARIHIFDTEGRHQRCLQGHTMGVWAMVPWEDTLVSGGCDRDIRVWDMSTGKSLHMLRGHTSTVRCLKMANATTAISGSRDTTLRIWDIESGICKHVLVGHQSSVRCIEIHGDLVVSGSYDTSARVWSISDGRCIRTLQGHFSQIYAVAFDGMRVVTGSLDTSVRVWDIEDGQCLAVLQGHTSLVGQLQLRNETLVTGGSDGSVRVWSMLDFQPIHRLAAHDNSITSLQFDDTRIVSGGSDGRVKVWDLAKGFLIRELGQPADLVRSVVFEDQKAVILASRQDKTYMEVWSFDPPRDSRMSPASVSVPDFGENVAPGDGKKEEIEKGYAHLSANSRINATRRSHQVSQSLDIPMRDAE